jgi:hypothetical protein
MQQEIRIRRLLALVAALAVSLFALPALACALAMMRFRAEAPAIEGAPPSST